MALLGFDSGEATQYPSFALRDQRTWAKVANQPSAWEILTWWWGNQGASMGVQTTTKYSGTSAFRLSHDMLGDCAMRRTFTSSPLTESFISFMFRIDGSPTDAKDIFALCESSMSFCVRLTFKLPTQELRVYAGAGTGTLKATIQTDWAVGEWHNVQLHVRTSDNTLEIKLDNGSITDCSGTTIQPWQYLIIGNSYGAQGQPLDMYFDCIQVNDQTGSTNNSWPGSQKIATAIRPRADTAVKDWSPSSGSDGFAMIDETSPDLDTTYLASQAFDDVSTFDLDTLTLPDNTAITGICLTAVAKRADAAYLIPVVSRGGSTPDLSALKLPIGVDYMSPLEWFLELDPITNAPWTVANLNSTHFGFKNSN